VLNLAAESSSGAVTVHCRGRLVYSQNLFAVSLGIHALLRISVIANAVGRWEERK
jgi:hypothetical protein